MTKAPYEVVYGALGSGKSSYALSIVDPEKTIKLGNGNHFFDFLLLKPCSVKMHEEENKKNNIRCKKTNLDKLVQDIKDITNPTLLIDEWTTFYAYSLLWSKERISKRIGEIFETIDSNPNLEKVIFVCTDYQPYMPFGLYKKKAQWNKELFKIADKITRIDYGVPIVIKE